MADSIKTLLSRSGVLQHVVLTAPIDAILGGLEVAGAVTTPDPEISTGSVKLTTDLSKSPIPGFDFALTLPDPGVTVPFKLRLQPAAGATSFKFWLLLADETHALVAFSFVKSVGGFALTGATKSVSADGSVALEPLAPGDPKATPVLVSRSSEPGATLGPALLVSGADGETATLRFTPDTDSTDGVIALGLEPSTVVFGSSHLGFELPALVLDDSESAKGPGVGAQALDPPLASIDADTPSWRGILARELDFYLPAEMPLFGGTPIKGYLAIPRGEGGAQLVVETNVPARPGGPGVKSRPGFKVRIECLDPTASGLGGLVPTLIEASMELPLDGAATGFQDQSGSGRTIRFNAGKPVRVSASIARDPVNNPGQFKIVLGVAAQGPEGILSVIATEMGGAKVFNTAAAMATALIADKDVERKAKVGDTQGVVLYTLLAAGTALSSLFTEPSTFVLHGVEIESSGHGSPVGDALVLKIDYSVTALVTKIDVGVLSVSMNPDQPMRIRVRDARLSIDFKQSGLQMFGLDFERSTLEIESPGAWNVGGLDSLFDVLGSRSGRGSSWIEVDLGFKLNLGPVKVSGATIRATLLPSGDLEASIRGLEAGVDIPGAIDATGALRMLEPNGFAADLQANIVPLHLIADASVVYQPPMVYLRLDVDLPAPIPLANTGFGLLGVGGLVAFSGLPDYSSVPEADPIAQQLRWDPKDPASFKPAGGQSTFGLAAAVGTLPDFGFMLSAKAGVLITVPDVAVRGSLNGKLLQPAVKMTDPSWPPSAGVSFLGFVAVDSSALSFGLLGLVNLKPLVEIRVPIAGHFPFSGDTSDWYVYLGADGAPVQGRSIGPISAKVLPDILGIEADAYLMVRGHGMTDWPYGRRLLSIADGFVVAFGFSLQSRFGVKPIVWAELYFSLDLLVATKPPTIAGFGRAGGSLNLGPFSLGVDARVSFKVAEGDQYFWAEVTGRIELFFFDVEGTVTISFGDKDLTPKLPPPDRHPLDRVDEHGTRIGSLATLTDDRYRILTQLVEDPDQATETVWPDAMVSLVFAVAPAINAATAGTQFPGVVGPGATPAPVRLGSEMLHYSWRLEAIELHDVTNEPDKINGPGTVPAGRLAARWQVPRTGPGGSDISELMLFSTGPDIWINRLPDGGASLPGGDPLKAAADLCTALVPDPDPAWTLGLSAMPDTPGFRLPPESVSANPWVSRVAAHMTHYGLFPVLVAVGSGIGEMELDNVHALPEPYSLEQAALVVWPQPEAIDHRFEGHLVAPDLRWMPGQPPAQLPQAGGFVAQAFHLELDEAIVAGELVLVVNPELVSGDDRDVVTRVRVVDGGGNHWPIAGTQQLPTAEIACVFRAPTDDPVGRLIVTYPLGERVGVVGLGGMTVSARDAVAAERALIADEVARRVAAAAAGPPTAPPVDAPHQRTILDPDRLYRIDVGMTWAGEVARQNEAGQVEVDASQTVTFGGPRSDQYAIGLPTRKHLFFRTAKRDPNPLPKEASFLLPLLTRRDVFRAEMLARYLAGYEPAQSEEFRFCDDPLRAHFLADHVAALAKTYGFAIEVAVHRVDRPGTEYAQPDFILPVWAFATNAKFLSTIDQMRRQYVLASGCEAPTPGSTASVLTALEPLAWYEVYVHARSTTAGVADSRLEGVTFRTSRWRDPADMLAGLGFGSPGHAPAQPVAGDLEVAAPSHVAGVMVDDDQAFTGALEALGLQAWPTTENPRLSQLWTDGGNAGWLFAGLLIESPEPTQRPGRLEVASVEVDAGGAPVELNLVRRDRAGARLLFLATTDLPIAAQGATVTLHAESDLDGAVTQIAATRPIDAAPTFAAEP